MTTKDFERMVMILTNIGTHFSPGYLLQTAPPVLSGLAKKRKCEN